MQTEMRTVLLAISLSGCAAGGVLLPASGLPPQPTPAEAAEVEATRVARSIEDFGRCVFVIRTSGLSQHLQPAAISAFCIPPS